MQSVLAVDDSPSTRNLVTHVFEKAGYDVVVAEDAREALDYAQQHTVDVVLTDINLPHLDGIDLIKKLRALRHYKYVPMFVLTTESSSGKKMEGMDAGATGWIVKPIDPDQLVTIIEQVLTH